MSLLLLFGGGGGGAGGRPLPVGTGGPEAIFSASLLDVLLTPVADLDLTKSHKWLDPLSEAGTGSFDMMLDDPAQADLQRNGDDLVQFAVDGQPVWTMIVEHYRQTTIDPGEESKELTTFSGRGHLALWERAVVYPALGVDRVPIQEDRGFNWTSIDYDDSSWVPATFVTTVSDAQINWPIPFDPDFPTGGSDPEVLWASDGTITSASSGDCYFRQVVTLADTTRCIMFVLIDNFGEVYIDGALVAGIEASAGFVKTTIIDVELSAGDHTIAVLGSNIAMATTNPGGIAWSLWIPGYPPTLLAESDSASCVMVEYATEPPGMTPGEVMRHCLDEAQARGELTELSLNFDDDVDSAGTAWPIVADISTKVGTDYLTFFREIAGTYTDIWMPPDSLALSAWVFGTMSSARTADFHPPTDPDDPTSGNLTALVHEGDFHVVDRVLIRWAAGWSQEGAAGSSDAGTRAALLGLGALQGRAEVARVGQGQLTIFANPREAITIGILPADTASTPYLGFQVGDVVTVPLSDGTPSTERVVAITGSVDDATGRIVWNPQLVDVILAQEERFTQAIKKMTNGTFSGRSKVAQPVVPVFIPRPHLIADEGGGT